MKSCRFNVPRTHSAWRRLWGSLALAGLGGLAAHGALANPQRAVLELFTSQGCSSCPPADAIAGQLSTDPAVLVLSYHVDYWDDLGWKDPFSSRVNTERQYAYARALGARSVFTPQLVINGTQSVVGSQQTTVQRAVAAAKQTAFPVQAELDKQSDGTFSLTLTGPAISAEIWEARYVRHAVTQVHGGENGGRSVETFNNVTQLRRLGVFKPGKSTLEPLRGAQEGLAIFVQARDTGRILGGIAY